MYSTKKSQSAGSKIGYSVCSRVTYDNNLSPEGCVIAVCYESINHLCNPVLLTEHAQQTVEATQGDTRNRERAKLKYLTTRTRVRQQRLFFCDDGASE